MRCSKYMTENKLRQKKELLQALAKSKASDVWDYTTKMTIAIEQA